MDSDKDVRQAIRSFLSSFNDDEEWLDGTALFSGGAIDSLMAVELISFLETMFGIVIDDDDLDIANFDSIDAIVALVAGKGVM